MDTRMGREGNLPRPTSHDHKPRYTTYTVTIIYTNSTYLELGGHEVVDDGVDGGVEVAHAVGDDSGIHEDLTDALLSRRVLLHVLVHEELREREK